MARVKGGTVTHARRKRVLNPNRGGCNRRRHGREGARHRSHVTTHPAAFFALVRVRLS